MKFETKLELAHIFYKELVERAETQDDGSLIFIGPLTKTFANKCDLPISYYSPVKDLLDEFECIAIIERGTRRHESRVMLLKPPPDVPPPGFVKSPENDLTTPQRIARLAGEVADLKAWRESQRGLDVLEALGNIETRLVALESKLKNNTNT